MASTRSVVSSAKLIALCTLLSRFTGLARDVLLTQAFGLRWVTDAFHFGFQVPNLFRRLLGEGAMAAVFVPTFTRTMETEGKPAAWRLLARTLALMTVTLTALIILIAAILLVIWMCTSPTTENAEGRRLLLTLTGMMLPFMLTICILALLSAILNCVHSFVPAALTPIILNIAMIVAIAWIGPATFPGHPEQQVYIVAGAVVIAGVLQLLFLLPFLRRHGVELGWRFDPRDPAVKKMLGLLVPVALGQGVLAVGVYLDAQVCLLLSHKEGTADTFNLFGMACAYPLTEGALATITIAQRLYQFPLGVLVISLATAAMPTFSRLATREEWPAWTAEVRQTLRLAIFEGILAGTMMIMLAEPIIRFLFEYREFTAADTPRAGHVLMFYGIGLWAFCAQHIVLRAFYSLHDVRTPLKITAVLLPLNLTLNIALLWVDGIREAAFAIGSATTSTLAVVVGLTILRRRVKTPLLDGETIVAILKTLAAGAVAGIVLHYAQPAWSALAAHVPTTLLARGVETLGLLAIGSVAFVAIAWVLRSRELSVLITRGRRQEL